MDPSNVSWAELPKLAKWALLIQQNEIEYVPQKATTEEPLTNFFVAHALLDESLLAIGLSDEVVMTIEVQKDRENFLDGISKISMGENKRIPKTTKQESR